MSTLVTWEEFFPALLIDHLLVVKALKRVKGKS